MSICQQECISAEPLWDGPASRLPWHGSAALSPRRARPSRKAHDHRPRRAVSSTPYRGSWCCGIPGGMLRGTLCTCPAQSCSDSSGLHRLVASHPQATTSRPAFCVLEILHNTSPTLLPTQQVGCRCGMRSCRLLLVRASTGAKSPGGCDSDGHLWTPRCLIAVRGRHCSGDRDALSIAPPGNISLLGSRGAAIDCPVVLGAPPESASGPAAPGAHAVAGSLRCISLAPPVPPFARLLPKPTPMRPRRRAPRPLLADRCACLRADKRPAPPPRLHGR